MSANPQAIAADEYLIDAAARMQRARVRHLPITDITGRIVGIISDRDVRAVLGEPSAAFEDNQPLWVQLTRVEHVMTRQVISVVPDTPVREVGQLFVDNHLTAIPVVDDGGKLVGMISYIDLIRSALELSPPRSDRTARSGEPR